eukprot:TRINITY_DN95776_c0_g1_i1.p1 TRINITY_DN95776_c0_g1~~TRINITY_DN95776_c0_g1_i1.p1  ORF type:complete len:181 (+),score=28.57 TRINITY_DN95776_c0_g1_i1:36-545(+)
MDGLVIGLVVAIIVVGASLIWSFVGNTKSGTTVQTPADENQQPGAAARGQQNREPEENFQPKGALGAGKIGKKKQEKLKMKEEKRRHHEAMQEERRHRKEQEAQQREEEKHQREQEQEEKDEREKQLAVERKAKADEDYARLKLAMEVDETGFVVAVVYPFAFHFQQQV